MTGKSPWVKIFTSLCQYSASILCLQVSESYIHTEPHCRLVVGTEIERHDKVHERLMGKYFQGHYTAGERVEIPTEWTDGTFDDWNAWKSHRLTTLGFYDQWHMRKPPYDKTVKAPPRIHLRGDGNFGTSSLTSGHMEFKVWLQNKIEEAASGKGSARFLSEQGRESEREEAMDVWDDLTRLLHQKFRIRFFEDEDMILDKGSKKYSQFRFSRHLMLLLKIAAWDRPYYSLVRYDQWAHPNSDKLTLTSDLLDSLSPVEKICREAIRALIGKSFTSEVESISFTSIPGMTFIEELQKRIFTILEELLETASNYKPEDRCGPDWAEFDEKKALNQLLTEGFGSLSGKPGEEGGRTPEEVTQHNSVKLAYDITNMMLEEGLLQRKYMTEKEYTQAFLDGDETKARKKMKHDLPNKLVFTDHLWEYFDGERENHPIFRWLRGEQDRWMYCPPISHRFGSQSHAGGLLTESNRRVVGGREPIFTGFEPSTPRCQPSELLYAAMNDLQDTQWEINLDFLSCIFDIELNDDNRTMLPPGGWSSKEYRIQKIKIKPEFETVFTPLDSRSDIDSRSVEERTLVLEWARRIIEHNANVFWHSWTCDFRGRMSPRCNKLSPHGNDLDRAIIRFKQWKPLGDEGIHWLRVHVHNMMEGIESELLHSPAVKQRTFEERSKWVVDNLEGLRALAADPAGYPSELKLNRYVGRSKALQRVAALVELDRVYGEYEGQVDGGDWSKVTSGQPIYLDASCNGYQHVAALLRDRDLAHNVNLIGDEEESPRDLYGIVADNADHEQASDLVKLILDEDDTAEAMERAFSRGTAKCPTMTAIYGSKDIEKCLWGRNTRGKPEFSEPIYELSDKDKLELEIIPDKAKQVYRDWSKDKENEFPYEEFKRHCKTESKWRKWKRILGGTRSIPLWASGSGLHTALMLPKSEADRIPEVFRENEYEQYLLTGIVAKSLGESIAFSTGRAFYTLEMPLKLICKESDGMHPGIRWTLADGLIVNNYYVKSHGRDKSSGKMPCAPTSAFTPMVPDWYSKNKWKWNEQNEHTNPKSKRRILVRMHHLYIEDERVSSELRTSLDEAVNKKSGFPLQLIEKILSEIDPDRQSEEAEEIRKLLTHGSYSLQRYAVKEADRIDKPGLSRGLSPNFVHSMDAYHMRTSITELSESIEQLSFWPVHDAFGTHACDVPEMVRVVKEKFQEMYQGRDLRYWLDHMVGESPGVEIDFDEDPLKTNDGPYEGVTVDVSKQGDPGLKTMCSERGLPKSGIREDLVNRLKKYDAEQEGTTVDELYPPTMLKDLWDQSNTTLDISAVADAGYLIS